MVPEPVAGTEPLDARDGQELWRPGADRVARSHLAAFQAWLAETHGLDFEDYEALWAWSVTDPDTFWMAVWRYFDVQADGVARRVRSGAGMPGCRWFEGARVNYAEHVLRHEARAAPGEPAFWAASETRPLEALTWDELGAQVRSLATALRELGIGPGDRVVSYMPNLPETAVAMLATAAIGAVWSSASPEFGARTVLDRFEQIAPKLAFLADGYAFGGKRFDRRGEAAAIVKGLPSLTHAVWLPYLGGAPEGLEGVTVEPFQRLLAVAAPPASEFRFERVPDDHPLWVLYSSGTTGRPKAIVHGHAGIVAEHLKYMHIHLDLHPGDCMFFYTTAGWMIWNTVVSALMTGASAVLYDGSPTFRGPDCLWRLAEASGTTLMGASPGFVQLMRAEGYSPKADLGLERLSSVILAGAPASPDAFQWFYRQVKDDLWVTSQSGGTEFCSGLVGGVPGRPVRAGVIQGRMLGIDVQAWDELGVPVIGRPGELVVTAPTPSMPLGFWGDSDGARFREAYFEAWPGVWRHGDLIGFDPLGGSVIYGRSDSTLNRHGVRIGTAEIYAVVERIPGIADSLVVCCDRNGGQEMVLFVTLDPGVELGADLIAAICRDLRDQASPRHLPDSIQAAPAIPYTLTGKKMEVPVRRLLAGEAVSRVASPDAMRDPDALAWYAALARSDAWLAGAGDGR